MREIGGYIELDNYTGKLLHENAVALNCGRNALAYVIESRSIKKICLPYFLCSSVKHVCEKYQLQIRYYHIREDFSPETLNLDDGEWIYIVNYYGQIGEESIKQYKETYKNIIIDNAQSYFSSQIDNIDTLYTCRKYFGVSDGAFLYTNQELKREIPMDESYDRVHYILGRYERTGSEFYGESVANNHAFTKEPIKRMSKLTKNLLRAIDYEDVKEKRNMNFSVLNILLGKKNLLGIKNTDATFMYPFMCENASEIRKQLQKKKIYIPILWPNVLEEVPKEWLEWKYAQNILPLPIDQRYSTEDMEYLVEMLEKCMN